MPSESRRWWLPEQIHYHDESSLAHSGVQPAASDMASSLQTLIKILRLEQQKGYENKAVIGGFARFAYHWAREAHSQARTDAHHALVDDITQKLREYEEASMERRPALLEEVIGLATGKSQLADEEPGSAPAAGAGPAAMAAQPGYGDDIGIGELDEQTVEEEEESAVEGAEEGDDFEVYGTFEYGTEVAAPARSVRERRGYARKQAAPVSDEVLARLDEPVEALAGIGDTRAEQLEHLDVRTVRDLLYTFPRRYDDYSRMKTINRLELGEEISVIGVLERVSAIPMKRGGARVEAYLDDGSGKLRLNWFNQPWMEKQLEAGEAYVASGKVEEYLGRLVMNSPEVEPVDQESLHAGRVVPVYPLTKGLPGRTMRRFMKQVVDEWAPRLPDFLPESVREELDLMDYGDAIAQAHFPDSWEDMQAALHRLAFNELIVLHLAMLKRRHEWQSRPGHPLTVSDEWIQGFEASLPYAFTGAQARAIEDIRRDMAAGVPMNRLLQGDVGSGKTVVAALACGIAITNGAQAAIMAPTSILVEQHYATLCRVFENGPLAGQVHVALLTGSVSPLERERVYNGLADGSMHVVVGTHALIQEGVAFKNLGLAIVDEQHRFGVAQRGALRDKADGSNPHLLVMTATPIPRTLALTLHADLDLTIIDEMPPGRTPVQTRVLQPKERERAYAFIRGQVEKGQQAYIICPLVEDSDRLDAKSAVAEYERLQHDVFPDLALGLMHGRMNGDEKEAVMADFYEGRISVLVSTTVIEVGIDVPNATVILIENANRFGLSQLHQLRGRVGRGAEQSYCLLVSDHAFLDTDERLRAVEENSDGFKLAEIDWQMRGAGDLLGMQQSGTGRFEFANLMDPHLIEQVQRQAWAIYERDPSLSLPEHERLAGHINRLGVERGDIS